MELDRYLMDWYKRFVQYTGVFWFILFELSVLGFMIFVTLKQHGIIQ